MRRLSLLPLLFLACTALAQDPLKAFPKNYTLTFDNPQITVIRAHYGPHENVGVHDHSAYPTIYIYLNDSGPVHFKHDENPPFEITRPPSKTGSFRVSPGRIERHTVQNLGDQPSDFLRIELKQIPVGSRDIPMFRGKAPDSLPLDTRTVEYKNDHVSIERVICSASAACKLDSQSQPSLIVAISPIKLTPPAGSHQLNNGNTEWLPASQSITVASTSSAPVHLLRVTIK